MLIVAGAHFTLLSKSAFGVVRIIALTSSCLPKDAKVPAAMHKRCSCNHMECTDMSRSGSNEKSVAGMQEGGLCLWDCDESPHCHTKHTMGGKHVVCRRPTYTTECSGSKAMAAAVVAISALPPQTGVAPEALSFSNTCKMRDSLLHSCSNDYFYC